MTTGAAPTCSSVSLKSRPSAGACPIREKVFHDTYAAATRTAARSSPEMSTPRSAVAAICSNVRWAVCQSWSSRYESSSGPGFCAFPTFVTLSRTIRSGSSNGSVRSAAALTMVKTMVLTAMPSASVTTMVAAKPGCRRHGAQGVVHVLPEPAQASCARPSRDDWRRRVCLRQGRIRCASPPASLNSARARRRASASLEPAARSSS